MITIEELNKIRDEVSSAEVDILRRNSFQNGFDLAISALRNRGVLKDDPVLTGPAVKVLYVGVKPEDLEARKWYWCRYIQLKSDGTPYKWFPAKCFIFEGKPYLVCDEDAEPVKEYYAKEFETFGPIQNPEEVLG